MSRGFVIDTSVAVKWFSQEEDTPAALALRAALFQRECRLWAPDLLLYELANALRFHPRFTAEDAKAAIASIPDLGVEFIPADPGLLRSAVDLAFRFKTTVYDACYLALADQLGLPLVSADEKLIIRAGDFPGLVRLSRLSV
jgi:predicted nucleic acid-binding protein